MSIITPFPGPRVPWTRRLRNQVHRLTRPRPLALKPPGLPTLSRMARLHLPRRVRDSAVAMNYLHLLGPLAWHRFPQRANNRPWPGPVPHSPVPYVAAFLVRLDQGHSSMAQLRRYLVDHPSLTWVLGFPLVPSAHFPCGFDVDASLPTAHRFSRILRYLCNERLQFLLSSSVQQLRQQLPPELPFGQEVALDTKHILAFVKENNLKAYVGQGRYDKTRQPTGDRDCKLGCKKRRNSGPNPEHPTPHSEGKPASESGVGVGRQRSGEFYWGYASGVVATRVPAWGEFVLAELTQTFDHSDVSYFFPLMEMVEQRLGFKPPFGTADAAYDAWYVYDYFHHAGGFAAVPLSPKGGHRHKHFNKEGLPLCEAKLPMPLKYTFTNRTSLIVHERGRHVCPLLFPEATGESCPIGHKNWAKDGCTTTMATSVGARIRYQLDRESAAYKALYSQRTLVERIFSQALALGIERPKLRNRCSITNWNTLTYTLINLRALQRIMQKRAQQNTS